MREFRTIELREALSLRKIADSGQCFRPGEIGDGVFRFVSGDEVLEVRQRGDCAVEVSCDAETWERVWRPYFDLERDYSVIQRDIFESGDTLLAEATVHGDGIRVLRQEPFEMLVSFVLSQRKSIPAIRTAVRQLAETYGEATKAPSGETVFLFPKPEALAGSSEQSLRDLGLGYRAPYVLDAARRVADGKLDLDAVRNLPDEEEEGRELRDALWLRQNGARALGRLDAAHCERGLSGSGSLGRPEARRYFTAVPLLLCAHP